MAKWVKIQSRFPYMWYMLSDEGEIYREMIIYVDYNGHLSGRNPKYFKAGTHPIIKKYKVSKFFSKRHNCYKVKLNICKNSKEPKKISLHVLLAKYFLPPPNIDGEIKVKFIDGDPRHCVASNLEYISVKEYLKELSRAHIAIYKIPKDHELYESYQKYLKNRHELSGIVFQFMRENNLFSGQVMAGYKEEIVKKGDQYVTEKNMYFMISDKDPDILKHDLSILKDSLKKENNGFYPLKLRSKYMEKWIETMKKKNFKIQNLPSIKEYIELKEENVYSTLKNRYWHSYAMEGEDLYLRVQSAHSFTLDERFKKTTGKEYLFESEEE